MGWKALGVGMNTYPHSLVVICPDALRDEVLALGMMLDPPIDGGLSVPLSVDGSEPTTHWGCHAWATPQFVAIMTGQVTPEIPGVTPEQIAGILSQITVSVDANGLTMRAHFDHVIAEQDLQIIAVEESV